MSLNVKTSSATKRPWLGWLFDFHTPGYVPVNTSPDPNGIADALSGAGIKEVTLFAKCHFGYSYYPTAVGTRHPGLKGDIFGDTLQACRNAGLDVLAYVSFGLDGRAGEDHPEWRQVYANGTSGNPGWFISVCPFTSYLDALVIPQIREIYERYRPQGYWFDTMSALAPCYCACCREAFRNEYSRDIPCDEADPDYAVFGSWRRERSRRLLQSLGVLIHHLDPALEIGFNQVGSLVFPEPLPEALTMLTLDPATHGQQSMQFSLNTAFGVSTGRKCDVMPTIFNQGWGDWSLASPLRIRQTAAAVWARGGHLHMGDRMHPQGRLGPQSPKALDILSELRDQIGKDAPEENAKLAPDVLLLHSASSIYGSDGRLFAVGDPRERLHILNGAHRLLLDAGINFAVAGEDFWEIWLDQVSLVIVPQISVLREDTLERLMAWTRGGGTVLCVNCLLDDLRTHSWLGLGGTLPPVQDHIYLPEPSGNNASDPVLVRGKFCPPIVKGAEIALHAVLPYHAKFGESYGWGIGPPNVDVSELPVLTRHSHGDGEAWHLSVPLFEDYAQHGNWQQIGWFSRLLQMLMPEPRVTIVEPTGGVEVVVWENHESRWIVLVNHRGEELFGTGRTWSRTLPPLPAFPVSISMGDPPEKRRVWSDAFNYPIQISDCFKILRAEMVFTPEKSDQTELVEASA